MKKSLLPLAFAFLTLPAASLWAQNFFAAPVCPSEQTDFVKHYEANVAAITSFNIELPPGAPATITWNFQTPAGAASICTGVLPVGTHGLEVPIGGNISATFFNTTGNRRVTIGKLTDSPNTVEGEHSIKIRLTYSGGETRVRTFRIVVRKPVDVLFVLDRSGSMECDLDEDTEGAGWPNCVTSNTGALPDRKRWDILKACVDNFIRKLDAPHTLATDRVGVVYFSGGTGVQGSITNDAQPFNSVGNFQSPLNALMQTPIMAEMSISPPGLGTAAGSQLARDGTSLGSGLVKAINERFGGAENPARRQLILLFTDGEQNTGNHVVEMGAGLGKIIQVSETNAMQVLNTSAASLDDIDIFTAGAINSSTGASMLLENIADNASGFFNVLPGQEAQFGNDFAGDAFNEIYNTASPQFIRFERHTLPKNTGTAFAFFDANKNVNRLIFEAYFDEPVGNRCAYRILKDSVDVTQYATVHRGEYVTSLIFNLYDLPDLTSEGKWAFVVREDGGSGSQVTLFATADDHHVDFDGKLNQNQVRVDEPMRLTAKLFEHGASVGNAVVKATILKPGDDVGDLLARATTPTFSSQSSETGTCASQKYGWLQANNPAALNQLKQIQERTITLTHEGNGSYSGIYDDVDVTGVYKIIYSAKYSSPDIGEVERMEEQTVNARHAPIFFTAVLLSKGDGLTYTLQPAFKSGGKTRLVGPGFEHAFGVESGNVKLAGVNDNCDGSYEIRLTGDPDADIKLWLADQTIYDGKANDLAGSHKAQFSLHAGITKPFNQLDSLYNSGFFAEVDLGYHLLPVLSLEAVGGYYAFDPDYAIVGGSLYLKGHFGTPSLRLTLAAGGGIFKPEGEDATPGYSLRAGLEKSFSTRLSGFVEGSYFKLKEPDYSFGTFGLGINYRF